MSAHRSETHRNNPAAQVDHDVVTLRGEPIDLASAEGREFTADVCRCAEGLYQDDYLRQKYRLSAEELLALTGNKTLIRELKLERQRRISNGQAARELASKYHATSANTLAEILHDKAASPRYRIASAQELRQAATATGSDGAEAAGAGARFQIIINLSGDTGDKNYTIEVDKPIAPMQPLTPINAPTFRIDNDE